MSERALEGSVVLELGGREGAGVCGLLLAQLGATVIAVEAVGVARPRDTARAQLGVGKLGFEFDAASGNDRELLATLIERSDIVLTSSDVDPQSLQVRDASPRNVVCDITAFGNSGPRTGEPSTEWQIQALSGLMDTTGYADGPPVPIAVPIVGYASGIYAAAAALVALHVKRQRGFGQRADIAMFDSAFVSLNAYLAGVLSGQVSRRTRVGNRHPTVVPWNLYETADGWILICAGNQGQWDKLCAQMDRPDIAARFATQGARMNGVDEIDLAIEAWTKSLSTSDCVDRLVAAGVAAGAIATIDGHPREANLDHRGMVLELHDPVSGADIFVPASPLAMEKSPPLQPAALPAGGDRQAVERIAAALRLSLTAPAPATDAGRPLAGLRVIEIGQYTTAPMCARNLAHLGADVIKVEKPGGDDQREWVPHLGGLSETFALNNVDKRCIVLDLHSPQDLDTLKALLRTADVLVENNKPGMLAKFGLSAQTLAEINPRLVHCMISAFGARSLYSARPGFDTVIQATSGFMAAVCPEDRPLKSGISTADVFGAEMALVAILGALEFRERTGQGQQIDLSMQDIACWLTATAWNGAPASRIAPAVVRCSDGYVLAEATAPDLDTRLSASGHERAILATLDRSSVTTLLREFGIDSAPVQSVKEAADMPQTMARAVWRHLHARGVDWPVLTSPLRLQATPPGIDRPAPLVNEDGDAILRELGLG